MAIIELFDGTLKRTFLGPSDHNEKTYDYYQRSARKDVSIVRDQLNTWFRNIPKEEQVELKARFKKEFDSAFYELFLYNLFLKLGFAVEIHPLLAHTSKRPDFLVSKDGIEIYIEAKLVTDKSHVENAVDRKINEFYDNFNKMRVKGFVLTIDTLEFKTDNQPGTKALTKHLTRELEKLDSNYLREHISKVGAPMITYEDSTILLIVKAWPTIKDDIDDLRPIGAYPFETTIGAGEDSLRDSISMKARRYGKLDKPFLVCVNSLDIKTSGQDAVENAVWGSLAVTWSENPKNRDERFIRMRDGVFLDDKGPRLLNLSGVLVTKVYPSNIPSANYWLFEHPFTENKFNFETLNLDKSYVKDDKIYTSTGSNLDEIFGISKDWIKD